MLRFHSVVKTWSSKNDIHNFMQRDLDKLGQDGYRLVSVVERFDDNDHPVYCRVWLEKCYKEEINNE